MAPAVTLALMETASVGAPVREYSQVSQSPEVEVAGLGSQVAPSSLLRYTPVTVSPLAAVPVIRKEVELR